MEKMNTTRRTILATALGITALGITSFTGLLTTPEAQAAWPKNAFASDSMNDVVKDLFDGKAVIENADNITLKAPDIAENGAVVPINVKTSLSGVTQIAILVADNPLPMTASFKLGQGAKADVSTRIKMGKTSDVIALVEANGKVYSTTKNIKVTIGGCGG